MFRRLIPLVFVVLLAACGRAEPAQEGFGAPVTDGFFTFTVNGFDCGALEVSRGAFRSVAAAQYCLLDLSIVNGGDDGRRFDYEVQRLLDGEGNAYPADVVASQTINPELGTLELQPEEEVRLTVVFDIANPIAITDARLHEGIFSDGVVTPVRP